MYDEPGNSAVTHAWPNGGDMKLSETAAEVIDLAEAIRSYWNTELPKRHPHYPMISPGEDSGPPPPEKQELKNLLASLPEDEIYKLILLMYLGRGDFVIDDLAEQYETLRNRFAKPDRAIAQLMEKAPLADYLTAGLDELKKSGIDVDQLAFAPVTSNN
jgi:hypothetical protein